MPGNRKILLAALALLACLIAAAVWLGWRGNSDSVFTLPEPNGYDDLIAAARMLPRIDPGGPPAKVRFLLLEGGEGLQLARAGLAKECQVPLQFSEGWFEDEHMPDISRLKALAQAFAAEGEIALLDQRWDAASASFLDAVRLGNEIPRGGVLIHMLVGIACEAIGLTSLEKIVAELGPEQCRELVQALERIDRDQETFAAIRERERAWANRTFGFGHRMAGRIASLIQTRSWNPTRAVAAQSEGKLNRVALQRRLLAAQLAARAYEIENGSPPSEIAELVPEYLSALPVDPFTGDNLSVSPIER
jgi:hypothetical protein